MEDQTQAAASSSCLKSRRFCWITGVGYLGDKEDGSRQEGPVEDCRVGPEDAGRPGVQGWGLYQDKPAGYAVKPGSLNPRAGAWVPEAGQPPESWQHSAAETVSQPRTSGTTG